MLAYTAWDGLQTIARQYDVDLSLVADDRVELASHRRSGTASVRRAAERIAASIVGLLAAAGLIVA